MLRADIAREAGCSSSVINGLADEGVLTPVPISAERDWQKPDPDHPGFDLSDDQADGAGALVSAVGVGFLATLLDGVPGAGKTEVYFEAVAEALRQNKQVLVMLPEIALSAQWLSVLSAASVVRRPCGIQN